MSVADPAAVRDPEGLTGPQQGCRKPNLFLLLLVLSLAVALAALGTFVLLSLPCQGKETTVERVTEAAAVAALKIATETASAKVKEMAQEGIGAHLSPEGVDVMDGLVSWDHSNNLDSVFIGSDFHYESESKQLVVHKKGLYYLYAKLSVLCVMSPCTQSEKVTLAVEQGPSGNPVLQTSLNLTREKASFFSDILLCLSTNDQLQVRLNLHEAKEYTQWQLSQNHDNFFGLLRVSSACNE